MPKKLIFNPLSGNLDTISVVELDAVGSSPNANGAEIDDNQVLILQPADATNPGVVSTDEQDISGTKNFQNDITVVGAASVGDSLNVGGVSFLDGGIDHSTPGGTLNIATSNADIINIGNSGATVNIQGDTFYQNVTNLNVTDKLITVNDGGSAGSGSSSGIEVEENGSATGYVKTSGDRNSWLLKAPNTAGDVTLTPGASGITLNQSSHDPVTVSDTATIDLTLATQALSADVKNDSLTNTHINSSAAIALSKLAALTADRAVVSNGSGVLSAATTTATEIGYVNGVTSSIQTQLNNRLLKSAGDINETSFSAANNQSVAADVTGLAFSNAAVRSFQAIVSVVVDATTDLYEEFTLNGIQKGSSWSMRQSSGGDSSGFVFTITNAGQVQYVNNNYTGFSSATLKFRATTTSV